MSMSFEAFLDEVINQGIAAAKADYSKPEDKAKLDGAVSGFEACRGKNSTELKELMGKARTDTHMAFRRVNEGEISDDDYWKIRHFEAEVEWVCNCVSAILMNEGMPTLDPLMPTARGVMQAAKIVGVKGDPAVDG